MPQNKLTQALADSLTRVKAVAQDGIINSSDISRTDRERLQRAGWLQPVIKGWYLIGLDLDQAQGSSTLWYSHIWCFIRHYLNSRYQQDYCLSAEISLDLHTQASIIPRQIIVITKASGTNSLKLPHNTSLLSYSDPSNLPEQTEQMNGLLLMPLELALCRVAPRYFETAPLNSELALRLANTDQLSRILMQGAHTRAANRLMGAFQFIREAEKAQRIKDDMWAIGYRTSPVNPFQTRQPQLLTQHKVRSPVSARLQALWNNMRTEIIDTFPAPEGKPTDYQHCLDNIEDIYQHDAYNSLSIEGYQVTPELIEKIRLGNWNPDASASDKAHIAAMAAKGYWEAYQQVKQTIKNALLNQQPVSLKQNHLQNWYRALFSPSVQAGILSAADLAGYRNRPVFIRQSKHVPPAQHTLMDGMETFFDCLHQEENAAVRAILGHFLFVFIHPYPDGNGRIARFILNAQLVTAGYPWTVIRLEKRNQYMTALESASVESNIKPFTEFIQQEMRVIWTL